MKATTKDLRLHTKALIAATDRGEEVVITWHGQPRARLVPLSGTYQRADQQSDEAGQSAPSGVRDGASSTCDATRNPAFGLWRDSGAETVDQQVRRWRRPRDV